MIEQLQDILSPIIIESAIESALLWVLVLLFLRWSRVVDPALRAVAFSLPLFLPVAVTTMFHVLVTVRPYAMPHFKPLEAFINGSLALPGPLLIVFLLAGTAGIAASLALVWCHWLAWARAYRIWRRQQRDNSPLLHQCSAVLEALATRLGVTVPRLILVTGRGAGSLALGRRSYVFIPQVLAEQLDHEELEALLMHEIAHMVRRDGLLNCLARICRNLMLFNPLAHLALSRFEREQEQAADDLAVRMGGKGLALASCLLKGYRFKGYQAGVAWTGLLSNYGALEQRVRRMMHTPAPPPSGVVRVGLGVLAGVAVITFALAL